MTSKAAGPTIVGLTVSPDLPEPPQFPAAGFQMGSLAIASRVLMAPMVGYNEPPLRRICRTYGSGLAVTEMIKPEKYLRGDKQVLRDLVFGDDERPLGAQLAVREADVLIQVSQAMLDRGYDFIDLNLGCPLKKECNKGFGAALLRDPERVGRLVEALVEAIDAPVTVKVRAGYELGELQAPEVAEAAVQAGAVMLCVHGRTKMGWYRETNSLQAIAAVVDQVAGRVPVVGNGDVVDLKSGVTMFRETGCDAVMIGRGAVGNPWLFRRLQHYLMTREVSPIPGFDTVHTLYLEHMDAVQGIYGGKSGFSQVRRYAYYYFGRFGLDNTWRPRIAGAKNRDQLEQVLLGVRDNWLALTHA